MMNLSKKNIDLASVAVFFDFDGTITVKDVVDTVIDTFSMDKVKVASLEDDWKKGSISSKDCLEGQLQTLEINKGTLSRFLLSVQVDPYFILLIKFLRNRDISFAVTSDGFDYFINSILTQNGINDIPVYSNSLKFDDGKIILGFERFNKKCGRCGHCKTDTMRNFKQNPATMIYVGDGLSDTCPASKADIIFAKGPLLKYCLEHNISCIAYTDLSHVLTRLTQAFAGQVSLNSSNKG